MTRDESAMTFERLESILLSERDALLRADFETLDKMVALKEASLNGLQGLHLSRLQTDRLRFLAKRNDQLFKHVLETIRKTHAWLSAESAHATQTYGADGTRARVGLGKPRLQQKL
jgi:hypothetical protein